MLDEFPHILVKRREWFVFGLVCVCYLGALSTLTYVSIFGNNYITLRFLSKGNSYEVMFSLTGSAHIYFKIIKLLVKST